MISETIKKIALEFAEKLATEVEREMLEKFAGAFGASAKLHGKVKTGTVVAEKAPKRRRRFRVRAVRNGKPTLSAAVAAMPVGAHMAFPTDGKQHNSFRAAFSRISNAQRKRFQKDGDRMVRVA